MGVLATWVGSIVFLRDADQVTSRHEVSIGVSPIDDHDRCLPKDPCFNKCGSREEREGRPRIRSPPKARHDIWGRVCHNCNYRPRGGCDLASAAGADRVGGSRLLEQQGDAGDGGLALLIGLLVALFAATAARRGSLPLAYVALGTVAALMIGFLDDKRWIGRTKFAGQIASSYKASWTRY